MGPKKLYDFFKEYFTWYEGHVVKYKPNRTAGGIDIYLDTGEILNFQLDTKNSWVLKRGDSAHGNQA